MARNYYSGWPDGLTEKLAIEPATAQLRLGLGLSLAIMKHKRRPRIQKMKCLVQKLNKWRMIETNWGYGYLAMSFRQIE